MNNKFRLFTSICLITGILSISFSGSAANNLSSDWSSNSRLTLTEGEKLNAPLDEKKQKQLKELNEQLEKDPRVFIKYKDSANLSNAGQKIATKLNIYNYNYKKVSTFGDLNAETITFDTKILDKVSMAPVVQQILILQLLVRGVYYQIILL